MRRIAAVALLFACRAAMPQLRKAPPAWMEGQKFWLDPSSSATGVGTSAETSRQAGVELARRLRADGMTEGSPDDPATLRIRTETQTAAGNFAMASEIRRGGRRVEVIELRSADLPCWGSVTSPAAAVTCAVNGLADRIEASPALAAQASAASKPRLSGRLAVLEMHNETKDLEPKDVRYFTDVVRGAVLRLQPQLEVITRENLVTLLQATGKDLANCEGECEVDTGRRIGADAIVSGELVKVGTQYKLSLRLHETRDGRLLGASVASGATIDELDRSANQAVAQLFQ